jgi:uncharacterized protein YjbI with pentapeptide repeats
LDQGGKNNWLWPLLATRPRVELNLQTAERESQLDELVRDLSKALGKEEAATPQEAARAVYKWIVYAAVVALIGAGLAGLAFRQQHNVIRTELINLSGSNLSGASLEGAYLSGADLSRANLSHANLSHANLSGANLEGANLSGTDLSDANLSRADLSHDAGQNRANLSHANLSGANLSRAVNLTQTQLDVACGDINTKLPAGLTVKPCSVP